MSDRRLWLAEPCPSCGARSGLRCQTSRYGGKPARLLHGARGWRQRPCPTCKAQPGELCRTPSGRRAAQPHSARLHPARRELLAPEQVWEELERWGAEQAVVRFSGGGDNQDSIGAVTLEAEDREHTRWQTGEGELPEALASPIWGRYALFRGHPRITGLLAWDVRERSIMIVGERGDQKLAEVLSAPTPSLVEVTAAASSAARDTSPGSAARAARGVARAGGDSKDSRSCAHCGEPLPAGLRSEARYCSKRCRQASSRHSLRLRRSSPEASPLTVTERLR